MQLDLLAALRSALSGRYEVSGEIGRGGMAVVCRARDLRYDREVAIKVLYPDLARAVGGERFLREIGILAKLSHPNILPLLDSGTAEVVPGLEVPWYAMPYVAEETLRTRLAREGALPLEVALRLTREICSALGHAHGQGFIHRDIKPENILLRGDQAVLADFGIARALTVAGGGTLSSTGIVVGTPAYMSPEQAVGSERLDGRSDLYSLGCVLYEMLAGHPPFTGSTPQAISARHQFEAPPPIRVVRPGVPAGVEAVVMKALAKVAGDRYGSAGELSEGLDRALDHAEVHRRRGKAWGWGGTSVAVITVVLAAWLLVPIYLVRQKLDPSRYVVLPFQQRDTTVAALITSDNCEELVSDILGRLPDHNLVSSLTVGSALATTTGALTPKRAAALARGFGAGWLVWGEVALFADTVRVTGVLYDAASGSELRNKTIRLPATQLSIGALAARFAELTYALVLPGTPTPETAADILGAKSFDAWRVYATGDSALNAWNLPLAKAKYHDALTLDPEFPNANLKLAQVGEWLDDPVAEWRPFAERAVTFRDRLTATNQLMATGLLSLASGRYPEACGEYRAMLARDSLDFRGWFGLGECLTKDDRILPDSASPSHFRFRTSYAAGIEAYRRGLTLVPSAHLAYAGATLQRLVTKLAAGPDVIRFGQTGGSLGAPFFAYPSLEHDTLGFVPYPAEKTVAGENLSGTWAAALALNRRTLLSITSLWLARFPQSRSAMETQSEALEIAGRLEGPAGTATALSLVRYLRESAPNTFDVGLAVRETRLLLKTRRYTSARMIAESALAVPPQTRADGVAQAGLAALVGRPDRAADLLGDNGQSRYLSPMGEMVEAPIEVARDANRLLVYAGFGEPADSIRRLLYRIQRGVQQMVASARQQVMIDAILFQPTLLGFPAISRPLAGEFPLALAENALARGDRRSALSVLSRLDSLRPSAMVPSVAPDFALLEARLWMLAGDTTSARRRLDAMLRDPSASSTGLLSQVTQAAAIGRAMAFRRALAGTANLVALDTAVAGLWGSNRRMQSGRRDSNIY